MIKPRQHEPTPPAYVVLVKFQATSPVVIGPFIDDLDAARTATRVNEISGQFVADVLPLSSPALFWANGEPNGVTPEGENR